MRCELSPSSGGVASAPAERNSASASSELGILPRPSSLTPSTYDATVERDHEHSDLGEGASQFLDESQRPIGIGNLEEPAATMGLGQFRQRYALDVAIRAFCRHEAP